MGKKINNLSRINVLEVLLVVRDERKFLHTPQKNSTNTPSHYGKCLCRVGLLTFFFCIFVNAILSCIFKKKHEKNEGEYTVRF